MNHGTNTDTNRNHDHERHHDHGHLPHRIAFISTFLRFITASTIVPFPVFNSQPYITAQTDSDHITFAPFRSRLRCTVYISSAQVVVIFLFSFWLFPPHTHHRSMPHPFKFTYMPPHPFNAIHHFSSNSRQDTINASIAPIPIPLINHKSLTVSGPFAGYPRLPYSCTNCKLPH